VLGPLEKYRLAFSVLAFLCFAMFIWARFYRKSCGVKRGLRGRSLFIVVLAFLGLVVLLFYPEIMGIFYQYE